MLTEPDPADPRSLARPAGVRHNDLPTATASVGCAPPAALCSLTAARSEQAVSELYAHRDPDLALAWVDQLSADMRYRDCPLAVRQLERTMHRWRTQIAEWHEAQVSNGPTETMNALANRSKRVAFGLRDFVHWRIRMLLFAGKPDWSELFTVTP